MWEHEHEGGGASRTPPATATPPLRSSIIEAAQTEPTTPAPPAEFEATPEGQNEQPSNPSEPEPEQAEAPPPPAEEPTDGEQEEKRHAAVPNVPCYEAAGKWMSSRLVIIIYIHTHTITHAHTNGWIVTLMLYSMLHWYCH